MDLLEKLFVLRNMMLGLKALFDSNQQGLDMRTLSVSEVAILTQDLNSRLSGFDSMLTDLEPQLSKLAP